MSSRFKESLGYIRSKIDEFSYHTKHESEFCEKYVEEPILSANIKSDPKFSNYSIKCICHDLYYSFIFIYETEDILDNIIYDGLSLERAESLLFYVSAFLRVVSTNVMIDINRGCFSYSKKYNLAEDVYNIIKQMQEGILSYHSICNHSVSSDETIIETKYDELFYRLNCKYIRNGIKVIKLFLILILFQISPVYNEGIREISGMLTELLRDILFNKRIIKLLVDFDINGFGGISHRTTRLKIYFALGNSDRYCIRIDFPHKGVESIHLNLNEPARKKSTGFPFQGKDYIRASKICKSSSLFDELFYKYDDLYWLRSNYTAVVKRVKSHNIKQGEELEQFRNDRAHLIITSKENAKCVSDFSESFGEALANYSGSSIYGNTGDDDAELLQMMLFQDYILEQIFILRYFEKTINKGFHKNQDDDIGKTEEDVKSSFIQYIINKFPYNKELKGYTKRDTDLYSLINGCLDYFDRIGL